MEKQKVHYCSMCKRDEDTWQDPAEATGLFVGKMYSYSAEKVVPYRGYLCEMHADQAEDGRFVSSTHTGNSN